MIWSPEVEALRVRIEGGLAKNPDFVLVPLADLQSKRFPRSPDCRCPLGVLHSFQYPSSDRASAEIGIAAEQLCQVLSGFESGADRDNATEWHRLGEFYRSHPRCILTQAGGNP